MCKRFKPNVKRFQILGMPWVGDVVSKRENCRNGPLPEPTPREARTRNRSQAPCWTRCFTGSDSGVQAV